MLSRNNLSRAFTMIELLVVMGMLATLSMVIVVLLNPAEMNRRSNDVKRFSELESLKASIDLAAADGQIIPNTGAGYIVLDHTVSVSDIDPSGNVFRIDKYTPSIPTDPSYKTSGTSKGLVLDISGNCVLGVVANSEMQYRLWGDGHTYILRSKMQSTTSCERVAQDGNNNTSYEVGTEPGLNAF